MPHHDPHPISRRSALSVAGAGSLWLLAACTSSTGTHTGAGTHAGSGNATTPSGPSGSGAVSAESGSAPTRPADSGSNTTSATNATRTVMLGLIYTARQHTAHLTQAITADPPRAATYTMLRADRQAHLTALNAEYKRVFASPPPQPSTAPSSTTDANFPTTPDTIVGLLRGDATTAQNDLTDAMARASDYEAQWYGSMAACEATHRQVLGTVLS